MPISTRTHAIAAAAVLAVGLAAIFAVASRGPKGCGSTAVSGAASIGGAFTLIDENGRTVTDKDVLAGPSLVYFGYTYCPDVCPTDTARNAQAVDLLKKAGYQVTPVFISVDPQRDTPEVLKEWTDYLHPDMIGLTGSPEQIKSVAAAYKTLYSLPESSGGDDYLVNHMTHTYLMMPETGFVEFFPRELEPQALADQVACFIDAAKSG